VTSHHERRAPWLVAACFLFSFVLWSLLSPTMSVPDEPAHAVKAAALWHGQLRGTSEQVDSGNPNIAIPITMDRVRVPESYAELGAVPVCYVFVPDQPAGCAPDAGSSTVMVETLTSAGRYPPAFYAVVGWPTAFVGADVGVPLMRLTSAVICAALLGAAFAALRRVVRADVAFVAIAVAAVPVLHFLAGSINPNGVEIAAAIALWCAALALVAERVEGAAPQRSVGVIYVVAGISMVVVRPLSPAFAALIVVWSLLWAGWPGARRVLTDRRWWLVNLPVGAAAALTLGWVLYADGLGGMFGARVPAGTNLGVYLAGQLDDYLWQAVGIFGWMDNGPVMAVVLPWLAVVAALVTVGALFARRRWSVVVLLGLCVTGVVLPAVLQAPSAQADGVAWQGRYGLPVLVGVPLLAAVVARAWFPRHPEPSARLVLGSATVVAAAMALAQLDTLQRYVVGDAGPVLFVGEPGWAPPIGTPLAVVGVLAASLAVVVAAWLLGPRDLSASSRRSGTTPPSP
jgi:hypothetical protein